MKEYNITITDDGKIFINNQECEYAYDMDTNDYKVDLDKKAILSLVNVMGYEPAFLFEEIINRLEDLI